MTNEQVIFQFVGWFFLLFLSNRVIKRTELSRLKDQLIEQVSDLSRWMEDELSKNSRSPLELEDFYTARITRIDLLFQQFNRLAKYKLFDEDWLLELFDLNIEEIHKTKNIDKLHTIQRDIIEHIEISYHSALFKLNFFRNLYLNFKPELAGALFALAILYYSYQLGSVAFGHG